MPLFSLFPVDKLKLQNLTFRKIGQDQPRVIDYINFVELESKMLNAKFQDHRTSGPGAEKFLYFYHI